MPGKIRDSILYHGAVSDVSPTQVFECRNAFDSTLLWVKLCVSYEGETSFNLYLRPFNSASTWEASQDNAVFWDHIVQGPGTFDKKVWVPLHDGDKIYMDATTAGVTAFLSGYQRTTT